VVVELDGSSILGKEVSHFSNLFLLICKVIGITFLNQEPRK